VPYQGFPDGLYLVMQRSVGKGIDHYGILDIGNRLGVRGADGINPVIVHQSPSGITADWLGQTPYERLLAKKEPASVSPKS